LGGAAAPPYRKTNSAGFGPRFFYLSNHKGFVDDSTAGGKNPAWQMLN
jgi:hypothetical protein